MVFGDPPGGALFRLLEGLVIDLDVQLDLVIV
jgi:hypothetical protein